jgi:hypothetical protein
LKSVIFLEFESFEEMRVTGFCDPWKRCARCLGLLREMGCEYRRARLGLMQAKGWGYLEHSNPNLITAFYYPYSPGYGSNYYREFLKEREKR